MRRFAFLFCVAAVDRLGKCGGSQRQIADCGFKPCNVVECVDCLWAEWGEWSSCTCEGLKDRHRTIKTPNSECGKPCEGNRIEAAKCIPPCAKDPVDCKLNDWGDWSECSRSCDGGQTTRSRSIKTQPKHRGNVCEAPLSQTKACGEKRCEQPVDGVFGNWAEWSKCSVSCGGGQQDRTRSIATPASGGGLGVSGALTDVRGCNAEPCGKHLDCKWGEWVQWSACSKSCNGGEKTRSRMIEVAPREGGKLCAPEVSGVVEACNTQPCSNGIDCVLNEWTSWGACSCSCKGTRIRARHIKVYPAHGGNTCSGNLKELQPCNVDACEPVNKKEDKPVDCKLSAWGDWEECSASCGSGLQHRHRTVEVHPANGGVLCDGVLSEIRGCNLAACGVKVKELDESKEINNERDCAMSEWEPWNSCSVSCGTGDRMRQRQVTVMPSEGGAACENAVTLEMQACNEAECNCTDCEWSAWSSWGACACTGLEERHRTVKKHYQGCGKPCIGPKVMTQRCTPDCSKDIIACKFSDWQEWTECTQPCGGGQRERTRSIIVPAKAGGEQCSGTMHAMEPCNTGICHQPVDCKVAEWGEWSTCSATCDGGEMYRHRAILSESAYGGEACKADLVEVSLCNQDVVCAADVDCVWGSWEEWSACNRSCGGGYKSRDRHIKTAPRLAGKLCEPLPKMEIAKCNTQACVGECEDAHWGDWSEWSKCSATCDSGYQMKSRTVVQQGNHCGKVPNGSFQDYRSCTMSPCSSIQEDCVLGEWSPFGACSCSCDGIRERARRITKYPAHGGRTCEGAMKEVAPCNVDVCIKKDQPVDCVFGEWGKWNDCTAECDGGSYTRERQVLTPAKFGGQQCEGNLQVISACNAQPCKKAVNCKWGEWSEWSDCSVQCGGGDHNRYRHVLQMAKAGGDPCEAKDSAETRPCNTQLCGKMEYCVWGQWSDWGPCSKTCGTAQKVRERLLSVTTEKPKEGDVLATGILSQLFGVLGAEGGMSTEQLTAVFIAGMVFASLLFLAFRSRKRGHDHEPLLLTSEAEAEAIE